MKRVLLLGDERKGGTVALVKEFAGWIAAKGHQVHIITGREESLHDKQADLLVVFGGDGSLLAAARRMGDNQLPTLGINRGRLGFLCAFELDGAKDAVDLALAGKLQEESRLLLACSVIDSKGSAGAPVIGMNDGVVSRAAAGGMITLRARRGSAELATYRGDGLIVATASGSTAYSMAAGGPVLAPGLDAIVLTPLASHTLSARPLVIPVDDGVSIELLESGDKKHAYFQVDGQIRIQMEEGARAVLRPAPVRFRHLGSGPQYFFQVLRAKFGFADLPRGG
jgi:NAD+ kinase